MAITQITANEIFTQHPTRFKKNEKSALRSTLREKFKAMGYEDSEISEIEASGTNLVVGSPRAEYLFTAHYDTPGKTGWLLGTSKWLGMTGANIFMIVAVLVLGSLCTALPQIISSALFPEANENFIYEMNFWMAYIFLLIVLAIMIISMVVKNKNNRNDNTSGVLSLLALAEKVSADSELRDKCCFVFFDNEEWGLLGSADFAKHCRKNGIDLNQSKVINFDCVGYGDVLTFVSTRKTPVANSVTAAFAEAGKSHVSKRSKMIFLSDHANFKNSVMVSYTDRAPVGLLYIPRIHTSKDTECDIDKINRLTDDFYTFVSQGKI